MSRRLVLWVWLAVSSISGSAGAPPAPEPLIVLPQGDFSCVVEVTPRDVPKPDPAHPERRLIPVLKKVAIARVGKLRRDVSVWSDASFSQLWSLVDQGVALWENNAQKKNVYLLRGELRDQACPKLLRFDADSVSWITEKARDPRSGSGGQPFHYEARIPASENEGAQAVYQAWVDPKTLLPQKFDDGESLYVLTFSPAPAGPLAMPPSIQAEMKRWQDSIAPHPHL